MLLARRLSKYVLLLASGIVSTAALLTADPMSTEDSSSTCVPLEKAQEGAGNDAVSGNEHEKNEGVDHGLSGQTTPVQDNSDPAALVDLKKSFRETVQPFVAKYCVRCHDEAVQKSGVRVDALSPSPEDRQLSLLKGIRQQLQDGTMPPADEPQPTEAETEQITSWVTMTLDFAKSRVAPKNGSIRRLTVSQYRNTIRDLLNLREDLTDILPPDGVSKDGFTNHQNTLSLSPLQIEAYFQIAEKALDLSIVDESVPPTIQTFRMDLGRNVNPAPIKENLVLGALNALLANSDFLVTEPVPEKPFSFTPFRMRTAYEFIEGYAGNDTVRGWRKFDSIYHSVFACVRGTPGYPKGHPYETSSSGLLLRPAIPSPEIFGQSNTYGPMANFKISLRELPHHGDFRVKVTAARMNDGLLLEQGAELVMPADDAHVVRWASNGNESGHVTILSEGIYQIQVTYVAGKPLGGFQLQLGDSPFTGTLHGPPQVPAGEKPDPSLYATAYMIVRLPQGELTLLAKTSELNRLKQIDFVPISESSAAAEAFLKFEKRTPLLGVHVGLRRDCGSTLAAVGPPQRISGTEYAEYQFFGAINDFPAPEVELDNVNYLAGVREIGVRSEFTDGRDMPRLVVRSVEFEGPYYETWPPISHRQIFVESSHARDSAEYAREVLSRFATRAFRRQVREDEIESLMRVFESARKRGESFRASIRDALIVVLTSPQFLFLIEESDSPKGEPISSAELASKLSYFLWNSPPDSHTLELAMQNQLHSQINQEFDRLLSASRSSHFFDEFVSQWLSLDKLDVLSIDSQRFPRLTRDTRPQLRQEPIEMVRYLIQENLSLRNLVVSDIVLANEAVANYYGLAHKLESGFDYVAIRHETDHLGGLLSQAGIMAALSDGRESNPIKRGAWLARKIVAEPPDDPPPNVPQLPADSTERLTLREKLERHRNQKGCVKCHTGIDPWGIPLEAFDAGGLIKGPGSYDGRSTLPDGTEVQGIVELKRHLAADRLDQLAFSFLKHATTYAIGRTLTYSELTDLQEQLRPLRARDYPARDVLRLVVEGKAFLEK